MSDQSPPPIGLKKRRLQGACDICRQKKVRCDSAKMPGNICTNCIAFGSKCTHVAANRGKKRSTTNGPEGTPIDLDDLPKEEVDLQIFEDNESARERVAAILDPTTPYVVPKDPGRVRETMVELARYIVVLEQNVLSARRSNMQTLPPFLAQDALYTFDAVDHASFLDRPDLPNIKYETDECELTESIRQIDLDNNVSRFYGKSSNMWLVKEALDVKKEITTGIGAGVSEFMSPDTKRKEFWMVHPWQWIPPDEPKEPLRFPPADLMEGLFQLYFANVQVFIPIVHQPTFERLVAEGLHLRHYSFGCLVLAICAMGSRYSDDPRVFSHLSDPCMEPEVLEQSAGWKWFRQIRPIRMSYAGRPCVYDLQLYAVAILYLQGTSTAESCWILLGLGIRYAQDVGAHRKKSGPPTVEGEMWKRAFWALICIDIFMSAFLGRPRATNPDDYDLDPPINCDDEYWENDDPALAFKQPPGRPSRVTFWITYRELMTILSHAQRTIYAVRQSDPWGTRPTMQQVVMQLDSALNRWIDSIPSHLSWDPQRTDPLHFDQSAMLYVSYYYIQIMVHRPFIPLPGKQADMSLPSLAICANAARSCSHVMDVQSKRSFLPMPTTIIALFNAAVVLLLNAWGGRRMGYSSNPDKELTDVYKCLDVLHTYEKRWQIAGRLCDIVHELISAGDVRFPQPNPSLKRQREESESDSSSSTISSTPSPSSIPRAIAGSSRARTSPDAVPHPRQTEGHPIAPDPAFYPQVDHLFGLPVYTKEGANIPVDETFEFVESAHTYQTATSVAAATTDWSQPIFGAQPHLSNSQLPPVDSTFLLGSGLPSGGNWPGGMNQTFQNVNWDTWNAYMADVEQLMQSSGMSSMVGLPSIG